MKIFRNILNFFVVYISDWIIGSFFILEYMKYDTWWMTGAYNAVMTMFGFLLVLSALYFIIFSIIKSKLDVILEKTSREILESETLRKEVLLLKKMKINEMIEESKNSTDFSRIYAAIGDFFVLLTMALSHPYLALFVGMYLFLVRVNVNLSIQFLIRLRLEKIDCESGSKTQTDYYRLKKLGIVT